MKTPKKEHYIGIDLGDKSHEICVLDGVEDTIHYTTGSNIKIRSISGAISDRMH